MRLLICARRQLLSSLTLPSVVCQRDFKLSPALVVLFGRATNQDFAGKAQSRGILSLHFPTISVETFVGLLRSKTGRRWLQQKTMPDLKASAISPLVSDTSNSGGTDAEESCSAMSTAV